MAHPPCQQGENFVYGGTVLSTGCDFVSCSEDQTACVWTGDTLTQTIPHPCTCGAESSPRPQTAAIRPCLSIISDPSSLPAPQQAPCGVPWRSLTVTSPQRVRMG